MKDHGHGSSSSRMYIVEARVTTSKPQEHRGVLLGGDWQRLVFGNVETSLWHEAYSKGFYSFDDAMALAHLWLSPTADWRKPFVCAEARLVQVQFTYTYTTEEIGVGLAINMSQAEKDAAFKPREEL